MHEYNNWIILQIYRLKFSGFFSFKTLQNLYFSIAFTLSHLYIMEKNCLISKPSANLLNCRVASTHFMLC